MVGYGGVQVDCGFFSWRCREDGRSHGYEPGSQEEESEFGWGHAGILGLSRGILGETPRAQLEIQDWSSRERLIALRCSNYLMI